jgi:hypothetical protein
LNKKNKNKYLNTEMNILKEVRGAGTPYLSRNKDSV